MFYFIIFVKIFSFKGILILDKRNDKTLFILVKLYFKNDFSLNNVDIFTS